jgi:hypothetical protein
MKGKMSSEMLKKSEERYERWALLAGAIVILGLVIEVGLAVIYPHGKTALEIWSPVVADVLVVTGVFGEIFFARKAKSISEELQRQSEEKVGESVARAAEANKRAAEADERAANAERDTEKLRAVTAWRRLARKEHEGLALALKSSGPGASIRFFVLMNDQESLNFAQLISIPFKAAGWTVGYMFESYLHGIMTGILLPEPQDNWLEEVKAANARVRDAFMSAEICFVNGWPLEAYMRTNDNAPLGAPVAWVYVGPKPMPVL